VHQETPVPVAHVGQHRAVHAHDAEEVGVEDPLRLLHAEAFRARLSTLERPNPVLHPVTRTTSP
jgi:hypothetical protein